MLENFPTIQIIPLDKLIHHEWHDDQRTAPLIERLKASGVLANPPMVMPFEDESGRYMVLDGANRTTSLQKMSYPHIIAQIVESDSPNLDVKTWNHILWKFSADEFMSVIQAVPELTFFETEPYQSQTDPWAEEPLLYIQTPNLKTFQVQYSQNNLINRVKKLNEIVDSYKDQAKLDRTQTKDILHFEKIHNDLCALVIFPHFNPQEILTLCGEGHLFPTGVTRFAVSPRALRVNFPLDDLASARPLEEKNRALNQWIQERIARKGVRYYSEPTVLFDE